MYLNRLVFHVSLLLLMYDRTLVAKAPDVFNHARFYTLRTGLSYMHVLLHIHDICITRNSHFLWIAAFLCKICIVCMEKACAATLEGMFFASWSAGWVGFGVDRQPLLVRV